MTRAILLAVFLLLLITPAVIRHCAATERLKQAERVEAAAQGALFAQACDAETSGRGGWGDCFRRKLVENGYRGAPLTAGPDGVYHPEEVRR